MTSNTNRAPEPFVISGALAYDGLGNKPFIADAVIRAGRIEAVAKHGVLTLSGVPAIDGTGLSLAPGFIDPHSHSDRIILENPCAHSRVSQGVTTEIVGNCGFSSYLVSDDEAAALAAEKNFRPGDLDAYAAELDRRVPAVNVMAMCGHNTLRRIVMGDSPAPATESQIDRMRTLLKKALDSGAAGLSSGLWYIPGKYSRTAELMSLSGLLRGTRKPYATHMRDEGDTLLEAFDEAAAIAANGSGILQVSHIKTMYRRNWHKLDALLAAVDKARANGLRVTADRYSFLFTGTGLRMVVPPPFDRIADAELFNLLQSAAGQEQLVAAFAGTGLPEEGWESVILTYSYAAPEKNRPFYGLNMVRIGEKLGLDPARACVGLLAESIRHDAAFGVLSGENLRKIFSKDYVSPGSDGAAFSFDFSCGRGNPRDFGTFPEFFNIAKTLVPPEEAIRRMTSLPCSTYNIPERGVLKEGYVADLVLFDENAFRARADFAHPHTMCSGVKKVFVAGGEAFREEAPGEIRRFGRFLRVK